MPQMRHPELPANIGISMDPQIEVYPEGYAGIQRDAADLALYYAEQGANVHLFASADSDIAEHKGITLYPIVPVSLRKLDLTLEQRLVAEAHAVHRTIAAVEKLQSRGSLDVLDLRWENPTLLHKLGRTSLRSILPKIVSFSCSPNDYIYGLQTLLPGSRRDQRHQLIATTALSGVHKRALDEYDLRSTWNDPKDSIEVMPFGVSFDGALFSEQPLTQAEIEPSLPLLKELKVSGKDYYFHAGSHNKAKGQSSVIEIFKAAQRLGMTDAVLVLAGGPDKSLESIAYYEQEVMPHINNKDILHVGVVGDQQKWEYMAFALSTIFCSSMEDQDYVEAYGRVLAESAGSGTPVVGFNSDTFLELMKPGVTALGFDTIHEGARALMDIRGLSRRKCMEYARANMSNDRYLTQMGFLCAYLARLNMVNEAPCGSSRIFPTYTPDMSYMERLENVPPSEKYSRAAHAEYQSRLAKVDEVLSTLSPMSQYYWYSRRTSMTSDGYDVRLACNPLRDEVDQCAHQCIGHRFFRDYEPYRQRSCMLGRKDKSGQRYWEQVYLDDLHYSDGY